MSKKLPQILPLPSLPALTIFTGDLDELKKEFESGMFGLHQSKNGRVFIDCCKSTGSCSKCNLKRWDKSNMCPAGFEITDHNELKQTNPEYFI